MSAEHNHLRWRFASCILDGSTQTLSVGGITVSLSRRPLELLIFLLHRSGEVVTKREIEEAVWPGRVLSESVLTKAMALLRQALDDDQQQIIVTVHGYGYRFAAPVHVESLRPIKASTHQQLVVGASPPLRPQWVLRSPVGQGGYGEVWLAEHRKTHERRVFKYAHDERSLISLKREVTLFRLLQESYGSRRDFVRLYEWNLDEPPYFIESEYVTEGSLPQWANRQGGLYKIPLETRIGLMADAADAIAAAHAAGVLHKDIKPSNLLVWLDDTGVPHTKLGDFGSARLQDLASLDKLAITRMGFTQTITPGADATEGTPLFFAPELIAGQLPTTQTDLYALGVILFQMLAGDFKRPLSVGWEQEIHDELLREDIALAAASRPETRLRDAAELARRLRTLPERHAQLKQDRQLASEATQLKMALERAQARRGWARALIGVMAVAMVITGGLLLKVRSARDDARSALQEAISINAFVNENLLPAADPMAQGGRDVDMVNLLISASAELDRRTDLSPTAAARLGKSLGTNLYGLGKLSQAHDRFQRSLALSIQHLGSDHDLTNALRQGFGELLREQSRFDHAAQLFADTRDSGTRISGDRGKTWNRRGRDGLGWVTFWKGDYLQSAAILEPLEAEFLADAFAPPSSLAYVRWDYAATLIELNRFDESRRLLDDALAFFRKNAAQGSLLIEWARGTEVNLHLAMGQPEVALKTADSILANVTGATSRLHWAAQTASYQRGLALIQLGRFDEAQTVLNDTLTLRLTSYSATHFDSIRTTIALAAAELGAGKATEALSRLRSIYTTAVETLGAPHPVTIHAQRLLGEALLAHGEQAAARATLESAIVAAQARLPPLHRLRLELNLSLARALYADKTQAENANQAQALVQSTHQQFITALSEQHPRVRALRADNEVPPLTL